MELLGATNVAGRIEDAARRPLTLAEIKALAPDVIIAASPDAAAAIRADAAWRDVAAVAASKVHAPPTLPFNWGPRPPSVNRLAGLIWLAYVLPGRPFDDAFFTDLRGFFAVVLSHDADPRAAARAGSKPRLTQACGILPHVPRSVPTLAWRFGGIP